MTTASPGVFESVEERTRLAGRNRFGMLLFGLSTGQAFGVNVFKVREVLPRPELHPVPGGHPTLRGLTTLRGEVVPVFDLAAAVGMPAVSDSAGGYLLVTEYNRTVQGFLVTSIDRIINVDWSEVAPPPALSAGATGYLTAVTRQNDQIIQILDLERIIAEITGGTEAELSTDTVARLSGAALKGRRVLVVDDSALARKLITRTLTALGLEVVTADNGQAALTLLRRWADEGQLARQLDLLVSDVEMPIMDGYTLTAEVRKDPQLTGLRVMLHTSLSGAFNGAMAERVGADVLLPKFHPDELAGAVAEQLRPAKVAA